MTEPEDLEQDAQTQDEATVPEDEAVVAEAPAEDESDADGTDGPSTTRQITPRQMFIAMAVVLLIALIALIAYLLLVLSPETLVVRGGDERGGLRPIMVIAGPGEGQKPSFQRPMGVAYGNDGRIYVADTENDRIAVFDDNGSFLFEFGGKGIAKPFPGANVTWEEGQLNYPLGMDTDSEGNLYVADFRNDQIQVFDEDGNFLRRFPDPTTVVGKGASGQDGTGIAVTDVAVHGDKVYATDAFQIVVFTTDGEFVDQWGKPGSWVGDLDRPNGIAVGEDGTIYVSDSNNNRVVAFDEEGEVIWQLGERVGEIDEQVENSFGLPRGIAVLDDGSLLVVDAFEFDLVRVSSEGELLVRYGERGAEPAQMNFPNGVAVDGDRILVSDKENDRVQVLELTE
jgi:DNA-binding beta-propeller fold protein YncE